MTTVFFIPPFAECGRRGARQSETERHSQQTEIQWGLSAGLAHCILWARPSLNRHGMLHARASSWGDLSQAAVLRVMRDALYAYAGLGWGMEQIVAPVQASQRSNLGTSTHRSQTASAT